MKDMYDYIMETPEAVREVIKKSKQNNEDCIRYVKNKKIGHIYLVASGTSYSAALSCINPIEKLMNIETAQIQAMQHITMHKQLLAGNSENPVEAILNILD